MKNPVTIHDVAKASGFSKATVSRVLNNDPHVQEETRTIIREVMLKLQYEPNNIARSLSRKRTGTIGVILEDITNPFYTEIARAIETVLQRAGYSMFLTSSNWIEKRETELLKKFIQNRVDGILIVPIESEGDAVSLIRDNGIPFVLLDVRSQDEDISTVSSDNTAGGTMAMEYLLSTGVERVLIFKGFAHQSASDRLKGARSLLSSFPSLPCRIIADTNNLADGYNNMNALIKRGEAPTPGTGIFALNDFSAMGVIKALIENGIRVPEDVQVIGYDDIFFSELFCVPLTTVKQPNYTMGEVAAQQLVDLVTGKTSSPIKAVFKPRLVIRKSTRAPGFLSVIGYR